ncbi:hypothetical protein [Treponema lecithinolyticum]|uniref:hypothetical protein n=1 Tax=Treponema lecithinolyticum TaxID=53418 RepID=UPI0028E7E141|nr:hypothetical protein [Treponema lecithinolyticum]
MKSFFTVNRIMYASAFFVLCIAIVLNITTQIPFVGFLPVVRWIDVAVNAVAAALCIFLFIKSGCKIISYLLFFIEGGVTVHMGFVGIGTLLFTAGCVFVFVNGDFKRRYKEKIAALILYWALITVLLYFAFNIKMMIFEIALTLFHFGLLACLYKKLESKLSFLLPATEIFFPKIELPPKGSALRLLDYGVSERQKFFIKGMVNGRKTYEELAAEYHVSTSVVKKDMAAACRLFGVTNKESLRILLLQYKIK